MMFPLVVDVVGPTAFLRTAVPVGNPNSSGALTPLQADKNGLIRTNSYGVIFRPEPCRERFLFGALCFRVTVTVFLLGARLCVVVVVLVDLLDRYLIWINSFDPNELS